ncbi:2,3-dihydro-2,3-dihydroxybenzoate synthetase [Corynebacterium phocae]|uniref:2,3-dihydro-2,3-dihydroxybenzoate synthetase n=1 Tax=Corynebacterium phocae TaxID=161895 RepID=A0A1L7D5C9_9CORY|nr:isochorismatase family protein [Corynebacterium phocae]APT93354.1 2,3-dihydro-2,3-dihydroxybenzoate synthetase [Corynebacterium phocae]KAA8721691.1 isochorismatase family protein [Corynebacterium phocae]
MAIPAIPNYDIPQPPQRRAAAWELDPQRAALLVHDMQNYFIAAYDPGHAPIKPVIANIARLLEAAREAGVPVFYSAQPPRQHPLQRGLLSEVWGQGMQTEEEAGIITALAPQPGDEVITKWRYSAFERTGLAQAMSFAGRDQLIITGVYGHMGCQVSAGDAFMKDIQPFMVSDAIADFSAGEHQQALEWVAKRCGVVLDAAAACEAVSAAAVS